MISSDHEQQYTHEIPISSTSGVPPQYYFMEHKPIRPLEHSNSTNQNYDENSQSDRTNSSSSSHSLEALRPSLGSGIGSNMQYDNGVKSRVYAGTSSLGRSGTSSRLPSKNMTHPQFVSTTLNNKSSSPTMSPPPVMASAHVRQTSISRPIHSSNGFPKTNGALIYESLSLGRPSSSRGINDTKRSAATNYNTLQDYHIQR